MKHSNILLTVVDDSLPNLTPKAKAFLVKTLRESGIAESYIDQAALAASLKDELAYQIEFTRVPRDLADELNNALK